jgi:hypothetical protein
LGCKETDMSPEELAQHIKKLPARPPLTMAFEEAWSARWASDAGEKERPVWYTSQKEHWLGWLSEYDGLGAYGRKPGSGRDAKFVYNHINNAAMLMWLAEASGLPEATVVVAQRAALDAGPNFASTCAGVRRVIPFAAVEGALAGKAAATRT